MAKKQAKGSNVNEAASNMGKDFELIVEDAQKLMNALGDDLDDKTRQAKERLRDSLDTARQRYDIAEDRLRRMGAEGVERTDVVIHEYPYHAMGLSFVFGLLLGMIYKKQ
jgi:ElaB/YqjD/DUF883 family membrane-anchored ribosome-binding protein